MAKTARAKKPTEPKRDSLRLAAIDVGSNSVHMIVAQIDADGGVSTLWRMKEMVGLGRISFPSKKLSAEAIERAVTTLGRFKQAALQRGAEEIVAVATSAIREAVNGGDVIDRIRRELKLYVKVVSAKDEAKLIYYGVRHGVDLGHKPNLIIDIGGGSVEFIVGDSAAAQLLESRKLGAARMTATFVHTDPIDKADRKALVANFDKELGPLIAQIKKLAPARVIGTSGTLENLARLCGGVDSAGSPTIDAKSMAKVTKALIASDSAVRETMPKLDAHRKEQIVAAAMLVEYLVEKLDIKKIHMCGTALREGILVEFLAKHAPDLTIRNEIADPRRRSILDLARRYHWQEQHGTQVATLSLRLFDQLLDLHKLRSVDRELIEYGAMLHDVGWYISPDGHHRHSQYLIENGGLATHFSPEEIATIALIARYHRKGTPTIEDPAYAALPKHARKAVDVGAAFLRIADGLDRSHSNVVRELRLRPQKKDGYIATLDVRADAEIEMWTAKRKSEWFERVFKRTIDFEIPT